MEHSQMVNLKNALSILQCSVHTSLQVALRGIFISKRYHCNISRMCEKKSKVLQLSSIEDYKELIHRIDQRAHVVYSATDTH